MISSKVFILASAFTLALGGAAITNSKQSALTSYNGRNYIGTCVVTDPPLQNGCSVTNVGAQCTVIIDWESPNVTIAGAYLSLSLAPTCLLPLRECINGPCL